MKKVKILVGTGIGLIVINGLLIYLNNRGKDKYPNPNYISIKGGN